MTSHVLMCEPTHYRIAYEINPWMRRSNQVITEAANQQWQQLHETLVGLDVQVELIEQGEAVPDMTFAANAGVVTGRRFIPANFRFPERHVRLHSAALRRRAAPGALGKIAGPAAQPRRPGSARPAAPALAPRRDGQFHFPSPRPA